MKQIDKWNAELDDITKIMNGNISVMSYHRLDTLRTRRTRLGEMIARVEDLRLCKAIAKEMRTGKG